MHLCGTSPTSFIAGVSASQELQEAVQKQVAPYSRQLFLQATTDNQQRPMSDQLCCIEQVRRWFPVPEGLGRHLASVQ